MRNNKVLMPFILTFALLGSAVFSYQEQAKSQAKYDEAVAQARDYAKKGIPQDAIEQYQSALETKPSLELCLEAGEVYLSYEDKSGAESWYESELLADYPKEAQTYLYGMRNSAKWEDYDELFSIYKEYQDRGLHLDEVEQLARDHQYDYYLSGDYQEVGAFSRTTQTAAVRHEGRWGYVNDKGKKVGGYVYETAGQHSELTPVVDAEGRALYVDAEGEEKINENFILEKDPAFGTVTRFQEAYSGLIPACNGEIWNYYDQETFEKRFGGYAGALPVANGVGAVSEDGETWALIGTDGELITEYVFDEVLADNRNVVCRSDVLMVKQGGAYLLVDAAGKQVGSGGYEDATPFYGSGYAAVKKEGRWLFLDTDGSEHDLGNYEQAQSFFNGLAAVKRNGLWGYINASGEVVIDFTFLEAQAFSSSGVCFVMTAPDDWQLLRLYSA